MRATATFHFYWYTLQSKSARLSVVCVFVSVKCVHKIAIWFSIEADAMHNEHTIFDRSRWCTMHILFLCAIKCD